MYDSELDTIDAVAKGGGRNEVGHSDTYGGDNGNILGMKKKTTMEERNDENKGKSDAERILFFGFIASTWGRYPFSDYASNIRFL